MLHFKGEEKTVRVTLLPRAWMRLQRISAAGCETPGDVVDHIVDRVLSDDELLRRILLETCG